MGKSIPTIPGMPAERIAKVLKESVSLVKEWIAEGAAPAK